MIRTGASLLWKSIGANDVPRENALAAGRDRRKKLSAKGLAHQYAGCIIGKGNFSAPKRPEPKPGWDRVTQEGRSFVVVLPGLGLRKRSPYEPVDRKAHAFVRHFFKNKDAQDKQDKAARLCPRKESSLPAPSLVGASLAEPACPFVRRKGRG